MKSRLAGVLKWALLALLALGGSLAVNCAIAPFTYLPDADAYYAAKMPKDVRAQLEHFYWIWGDAERRHAAHEEMRGQNPEWDLISRAFFATETISGLPLSQRRVNTSTE